VLEHGGQLHVLVPERIHGAGQRRNLLGRERVSVRAVRRGVVLEHGGQLHVLVPERILGAG